MNYFFRLISFIVHQVISLLWIVSGISAQCLVGNDSPTMMSPTSKMSLTESRLGFALESLKKTALIESRDNVFFSPHSLHQALSLAYFGARGTTEQALKAALHIPSELSKVDVQRYYAFEKSINQLRDSQVRFRCRIAQCPSVTSR